MAVLETIRVKFGILITVLIGVALLSFIVDPNTFSAAQQDNEQPKGETVAHINGTPVYYSEFAEEYDKQENIHLQRTNRNVSTQQERDSIAVLAWNEILMDKLYAQSSKDAGYQVPEDELYHILVGNYGNYGLTPEFLANLEQRAQSDPMVAEYYVNLVNGMERSRYIDKYMINLNQSDFVNSLMIEDYIKSNSELTSFDYVKIPCDDVTGVEVTEEEINDYYQANKQFYSRHPQRVIDYVSLEIKCSPEEVEAVEKEFTTLYEEFKSTDNIKDFLFTNSDKFHSDYWYMEGQLESKVSDFVFNSSVSEVSEIISYDDKFQAIRVLDEEELPVHVTLSVLDNISGAMAEDIMAQYEKVGIDSLSKLYSFSTLNPVNINTAMISFPDFDLEKPFLASNNDGSSALIYVSDKGENVTMKKVAIFEKNLIPSQETKEGYRKQAEEFAQAASAGSDAFYEAVRNLSIESEYAIHDNSSIYIDTRALNNISNAKSVVKWAFETSVGSVSDVISIDEKFLVVATVKEVNDGGVVPKEEIRKKLEFKKAIDIKHKEVAESIKGMDNLRDIADKYGVDEVLSESNVIFSNNNIVDGILVGAACSSPVGVVSSAIKGNDAIYVFKVTERSQQPAGVSAVEAESYYETKKNSIHHPNMMYGIIMSSSDIDNRIPLYL